LGPGAKVLIAVWVLALAGAMAWLLRPIPEKPAPPGWHTWKDVGAVRDLLAVTSGVLAGGTKGLFLVQPAGSPQPVAIPPTVQPVAVHDLLLDSAGVLYVAHESGLAIRRNGAWKNLTTADGLPDNTVRAVTLAGDGTVWLGTDGGAARIAAPETEQSETIMIMPFGEERLNLVVSEILSDRKGGLWFGTYAAPAGGLSCLHNGQWQHWTMASGLPHANVTSLLEDHSGRVWAGCGLFDRGGAAVFVETGGSWTLEKVVSAGERAGRKVRSLYEDRFGRIWLGTEYDGVTVRKGATPLKTLTTRDGLAHNEVMAMVETDDGALWLGTLKGLTRIDPLTLTSLFSRTAEGTPL
jgi:ligand-binding sensor domain-containing protein